MNERKVPITVAGKKHKMFFSTQAYLELFRKYGGIDKAGAALDAMDEAEQTEEYARLIALLINQGVEVENEETGGHAEHITTKSILLHLTPGMMADARRKFFKAVNIGMRREIVRLDEDEDRDEEIEGSKNGEGAAEK